MMRGSKNLRNAPRAMRAPPVMFAKLLQKNRNVQRGDLTNDLDWFTRETRETRETRALHVAPRKREVFEHREGLLAHLGLAYWHDARFSAISRASRYERAWGQRAARLSARWTRLRRTWRGSSLIHVVRSRSAEFMRAKFIGPQSLRVAPRLLRSPGPRQERDQCRDLERTARDH